MLFKFIWSLLSSFLIYTTVVSSRDVKPNLPRWMDHHHTIQREAADFSFDKFHGSQAIYEQIERIGKIKENVKIGNLSRRMTHMERMVKLVSIQSAHTNKNKLKTRIFVIAGVHGRDWYSTAAAMYLLHQLTMKADQNKEMLDHFDWFIVPLMNPDGYNLTQSNNFAGFKVRDWRKNCYQEWLEGLKVLVGKSDFDDPDIYFNFTIPVFNTCGGIDIEKNYEYQWLNYDHKQLFYHNATVCQRNFPGYERHSAREAGDFTDVMGSENEEKISLFINIREGGTAIAHPYCYTKREFEYKDDLDKLTAAAGEAGMFPYGQRSELFPLTAGDIEDYVESHFSIRNSISLYIKDYKNSKHLQRGNKIQTRSRRAFKAIEELAKKHKNYIDKKALESPRGRDAGPRSSNLRFRTFMRPGYRAVPVDSDSSAVQTCSLMTMTVIGLVLSSTSIWT